MKAVLVNGSARAHGSCNYLADVMIDAFNKNGVETGKYAVSQMNISYCKGCKSCYHDGKCVINDDVEMIVRDILSSDFVVIITPSYWADVPGQLKTFFDRNTPFGDTNSNRLIKAGKQIKGIGIAVRAGKSERENDIILDFIDRYYGHLGIETVKRFSITEVDSLEDLMNKKEVTDQIYKFVENCCLL